MEISRRSFVAGSASAGFSAAVVPSARGMPLDDTSAKPIRVVAYNVYGMKGWPKERKLAKKAVTLGQMAKRLAMELKLQDPDLVSFSESPDERLTLEVAELLGMKHVRFPSGGNWPGTLLSKGEFIESRNVPLGRARPVDLFTRHWGRATVRVSGGESLVVHSAHLYPGADPSVRLREIRAMIESMKNDLEAGRPMLLIGDLNHGPDSAEYALWMEAGWVDTFARVGTGDGRTFKSDRPEWRIDFVMAAGPMVERLVESKPLYQGAFRLNTDDKEAFALSDHLPQLAVFRPGDGGGDGR